MFALIVIAIAMFVAVRSQYDSDPCVLSPGVALSCFCGEVCQSGLSGALEANTGTLQFATPSSSMVFNDSDSTLRFDVGNRVTVAGAVAINQVFGADAGGGVGLLGVFKNDTGSLLCFSTNGVWTDADGTAACTSVCALGSSSRCSFLATPAPTMAPPTTTIGVTSTSTTTSSASPSSDSMSTSTTDMVSTSSAGDTITTGSNEMQSPVIAPSTDIGAIIGGVVGGIVLLCIIVGLAVWLVRRKPQPRGDTPMIPTHRRESVQGEIPEEELSDLRHIENGSFGKVYKAYRKDEWVAVKTVNHDALGRDEDILNEVAVLKKIGTHNHIVAFRGFTTVNGQPALVLKFYDAGSLLSKLTNARNADWPKERQLKVASGIAAGVAYLHRNGIIHRDLAARNVLLTSDDVARVTDFGLSLKSSALEMKASSPAGAVSWMAPEQLIKDDKGQYTFSTKSDVYSFGVVLFELFERKAPWSECESRAEIVNKLQSGETLKTNDRKYPSDVIAIVQMCWSAAKKRPEMEMVAGLLDKSVNNSKRLPQSGSKDLYPDDDTDVHPAPHHREKKSGSNKKGKSKSKSKKGNDENEDEKEDIYFHSSGVEVEYTDSEEED
jgi:serine/threonine protein kinase